MFLVSYVILHDFNFWDQLKSQTSNFVHGLTCLIFKLWTCHKFDRLVLSFLVVRCQAKVQRHFQRLLYSKATINRHYQSCITMISLKIHVKRQTSILFVFANQTSWMPIKMDKSWAFQVFHSKYCAFTMANISNYLYIFERIIGCNLTKMSGTE